MRTAERHERICDRRLEDACTDRSLWAPELEACAEACVGLAVRMSRENRRTIPASLVTLCNFLTNESVSRTRPPGRCETRQRVSCTSLKFGRVAGFEVRSTQLLTHVSVEW
jgi:hypothetical protein